MDLFIFIIGLLMFILLIGYSIKLAIKKEAKVKLKKSFAGVGIGLVLMIIGLSMGGAKTDNQIATSNTATTTQQTDQNKQNPNYEEVKVTKHVDGDTVEITHKDGKTDKVRFIGVNTPESTKEHEQYGQEASNFTKDKLLNKTVYLEKDAGDTDSYGRLLRYVWLEVPKDNSETEIKSKMFNYILVSEGYAQQMTVTPNVKYADYFKQAVADARTNNKGLWAINPNGTTKGDNITPAPTQNSNSNNGESSLTFNEYLKQQDQQSTNNSSKNSSNSNANTETKQYQNAQVQETPTAETVYITPTGKKYHRSGCRTIKGSSKAISKQEAIGEGYDACKVCNP